MQRTNGLLAIMAAGAIMLPAGAMANDDPVAHFFRSILASPGAAQHWDRDLDRAFPRGWSRGYQHDDDDDGRRGRRAHDDDDDDGRKGRRAHDDDDDGRRGRDFSRGHDRDPGRGRGGRGGKDDNDDDD